LLIWSAPLIDRKNVSCGAIPGSVAAALDVAEKKRRTMTAREIILFVLHCLQNDDMGYFLQRMRSWVWGCFF